MNLKTGGRKFLKWSGIGIAVLLILVVAFFGLIQTPFAKNRMAQYISGMAGVSPSYQLEIKNLNGFIPFNITAGQIDVRDRESVWMTIHELKLDWSPFGLIRRKVRIKELTASSILVARKPVSEPVAEESTEQSQPFHLPQNLPSIRINHIAVDRIELASPVLGREAQYTLDGKLQPSETDRGLIANLNVVQTDVDASKAVASLEIRGSTPTLAIHADIEDEENGLFLWLMKQENAGPLKVSLHGEGPLQDWRGQLKGFLRKYGAVEADVWIDAEPPYQFAANGFISPASDIVPEQAAPFVNDRNPFAFVTRLEEPNRVVVQNFSLKTTDPALQLQGVYELETQQWQTQFTLALDDMGTLESLAKTPLSGDMFLQGDLSGTAKHPQGHLTLQAHNSIFQNITADTFTTHVEIISAQNLDAPFPAVHIIGSGSAENLRLPQDTPLPANLQWDFEVETVAKDQILLHHFALTGEGLVINASGVVNAEILSTSMTAQWQVADIGILMATPESSLAGQVILNASVIANIEARAYEVDFLGTASDLVGLPTVAQDILGRKVMMDGRVHIHSGAEATVSRIRVQGAAANLIGSASLNIASKEIYQSQWRIEVPQLAKLEGILGQEAKGSLNANLEAKGPLDDLVLNADFHGKKIVIQGREMETLSAKTQVEDVTGNPKGFLEFNARHQGMDIQGHTRFAMEENQFVLSELRLQAPKTQVNGNLTYNTKSKLIDGTLDAKWSDLSVWGNLAQQELNGSLNALITLTSTKASQQAKMDIRGQNLFSNFGQLDRLNVKGDLADVLHAPTGRFDLTANGYRKGRTQIDIITLNAQGNRKQMDFDLRSEGRVQTDFSVRSTGSLAFQNAGKRLELGRLQGRMGQEQIQLLQPVVIVQDSQGLAVDDLRLQLGAGRITASGEMRPNTVTIDAEASRFSLDLLHYAGVSDVSGTIDARLEVRGHPADPKIHLDWRGNRIRYHNPTFQNFKSANLVVNADYLDGHLDAHGELSNVFTDPVMADVRLPMRVSLSPFEYGMEQQGLLAGRVQGRLDMATLPSLLAWDAQNLTGQASADLEIGGTVQDPQINGQILMRDGSYDNLVNGYVFRNIHLSAVAKGRTLEIAEFRAGDGGDGTITAQGKVEFGPEMPVDLRFNLDKATLLRRDDLTAEFSGTAALTGPIRTVTLTGNLKAEPTEIRVPEQMAESISEVDVIEVNTDVLENRRTQPEEKQVKKIEEEAAKADRVVGLNLNVKVPGRVFVRGRGLDSEWNGDLEITGTNREPSIRGTLSIVRGFFNFFGNRLELTRGTITFSGSTPPHPYIDVIGETNKKGTTFTLRVTGPVSQPELALSSNPPLPQDEVLAQLLFGRRLTDISPLQAIQLAQAANSMRGGGGALDFMSNTRDVLGLDQLELRQGEAGEGDFSDAAIGVGKYLTDDIYVDFQQGIGMDSSKVSIEIEITPNISFESEVGMDQSTGLGVNWKYDY